MEMNEIMQENTLDQGINLMLYGMGSVVVFLTVLVIATVIMSAIVQRFFPQEPESLQPIKATPLTGVSDPKVIAIIEAAIKQHRAK